MTYGEELKIKREATGMSQGQFGKLLGTDGSTICRYEVGHSTPKPERQVKIRELLGVSLADGTEELLKARAKRAQKPKTQKPKKKADVDDTPMEPVDWSRVTDETVRALAMAIVMRAVMDYVLCLDADGECRAISGELIKPKEVTEFLRSKRMLTMTESAGFAQDIPDYIKAHKDSIARRLIELGYGQRGRKRRAG